MKESPYDPTLKEHFTENEAREWIRHLVKIIDTATERSKRTKEKNAYLAERNTYHSRKAKRLEASNEFLQKRVDQLLEFITGNGLTPPDPPANEYVKKDNTESS